MPFFKKHNNKTKSVVLSGYDDIKRHIKNGVLIIPDNYEKINNSAFSNCDKIKKVIIGENIIAINPCAFSYCNSLKEVYLPNTIEFIGPDCFMGCKNIEKFVTPINKYIKIERVFSEQIEKMNFVYKIKGDDRFIFSFYKPTEENVEGVINLNDLSAVFSSSRLPCTCDDLFKDEKFGDVAKLVNEIKRNNLYIDSRFIEETIGTNKFNQLANADLSYFKNEFSDILKKVSNEIKFYKFAMALGCFSDKKIVDNMGRETDILLSHKACSLLSSLIKKGKISLLDINLICNSDFINYPNPSQEFLKFISEQGPNKSFPNLNMLLKLEKNCNGIFAHTMAEFEQAKNKRNYVDADGYNAKRPWEDALITFYKKNKFINVDEDNKKIADRFAEFGLDQEKFDKATELYRTAKRRKISNNILQKEIKEETILDGIKRIKQETKKELAKGKELIEELYEKQFTYEFLDKSDPDNFIIGLLCSCCSHIASELYGKEIAKATIIAPDVQNLVVRDSKGKIVGKGAMYVNFKYGYAVINDFEINEKYKKDETFSDGYYRNDDLTTTASKQRKHIFDAFMRGIKAFVKEYDLEHPGRPLKKVNIGWDYNRLKKLCEQYEKETRLLHVPFEYRFDDTAEEQYILYDRNKEITENKLSLEK